MAILDKQLKNLPQRTKDLVAKLNADAKAKRAKKKK